MSVVVSLSISDFIRLSKKHISKILFILVCMLGTSLWPLGWIIREKLNFSPPIAKLIIDFTVYISFLSFIVSIPALLYTIDFF